MRFAKAHSQSQEDTRKVKTQTTSQTVEVRADGEGLVSHAGAFLLVELADRLELTAALSEAMAPTRERRSAHDPGVVVRDLAVSVADGGDCLSDLGVLRGQEALFGTVASESTAHRVLKSIERPGNVFDRLTLLPTLPELLTLGRRVLPALPCHRNSSVSFECRECCDEGLRRQRLWLPPDALLPGGIRRSARRHPAAR